MTIYNIENLSLPSKKYKIADFRLKNQFLKFSILQFTNTTKYDFLIFILKKVSLKIEKSNFVVFV